MMCTKRYANKRGEAASYDVCMQCAHDFGEARPKKDDPEWFLVALELEKDKMRCREPKHKCSAHDVHGVLCTKPRRTLLRKCTCNVPTCLAMARLKNGEINCLW